MHNTAFILARFISEIRFEDIPQGLVNEAKRLLMDSLGCAIAGTCTEKGKIALAFAGSYRSPAEATIIGAEGMAPAPLASFVNGELINAMDYDALCAPSGHITPYVLAAPLAMAEWKKAHGRDLITAIIISHEIAQRVSAGLLIPGRLSKKTAGSGISLQLPIHGYGVNIFGGIAGAAKILGLTSDRIGHAFGIGASMCPVPTVMQFAETVPSSMSKFSSSGWISQAEATAVLLAEGGYTGAFDVFDSEFAFWKSFGADGWDPGVVLSGLGKGWYFSDAVGYKKYPCCGAMHNALDIFYAIIEKFSVEPQEIRELNIAVNLLGELALWKNRSVANQIDAQFSIAYVFAVAAYRIEIGHRWQEKEVYQSPKVREFMRKIKVFTPASIDYNTIESLVEVVVRDKTSAGERRYTEKDVPPVSGVMNERELYAKFKRNAEHLLSPPEVERVLKTILSLEELEDVSRLMAMFTH